MSEFELNLLRQRSQEALRQKALRGELQFRLPVGFRWAQNGKIEMDPDLREEHHPDGPTEDIFVFKMAEHFWYGQRASWLLAKHLSTNEDSNEVDDNGKLRGDSHYSGAQCKDSTANREGTSYSCEIHRPSSAADSGEGNKHSDLKSIIMSAP